MNCQDIRWYLHRIRWWPSELRQQVRNLRYQPGTLVCDCRYKHLHITARHGDDVELEDGFRCSVSHCIHPVPHDWDHPC